MDLLPSPTPAFTRLPTELLVSILEQEEYVTDDYARTIVDFATLKSLRLASRAYAYLPRLLAEVFYYIRIEASPEQVEVAEWLDLSYIQPYVRVITMAPSKYSWAMTEDNFPRLIWSHRDDEIHAELYSKGEELGKAGGDHDAHPALNKSVQALGLTDSIEKPADDQMPHTNNDVTTSYDRYIQLARRLKEMFVTRQVDRAWTRALAQLPNVEIFRFGTYYFDDNTVFTHSDSKRRQLEEPVGEALFRAAIASLIAARSIVSHLEVECVLDNKFTWADDGTVDGLDLSQLRDLLFDPDIMTWQEKRDWTREFETTAIARCDLAIVTLLQKCSSSLVELTLFPEHCSSYIVWPSSEKNQPPILPALERFTTGTNIDLTAFARFISRSPCLSHLQLTSCAGAGLWVWRDVWNAIRDHPNRMKIDCHELSCNEYADCSVYFHTGESSKADFNEDPWENLQYSLENYLSGRGHWNRTLCMWFEDSDGSYTDESNDTEDSSEAGS